MTKRKASDCFVYASPNTKSRQCFSVPQWVDQESQQMDMATSPPVKRVRIFGAGSPGEYNGFDDRAYSSDDVPMGSPNQRMAASPRQSIQPCRMVPLKDYDAVQAENTMLRDALAALTRELAESRSRIAQLEAQCSQSHHVSRGCLATGFRSPFPQAGSQPMYFAPHQYVPRPQCAQ